MSSFSNRDPEQDWLADDELEYGSKLPKSMRRNRYTERRVRPFTYEFTDIFFAFRTEETCRRTKVNHAGKWSWQGARYNGEALGRCGVCGVSCVVTHKLTLGGSWLLAGAGCAGRATGKVYDVPVLDRAVIAMNTGEWHTTFKDPDGAVHPVYWGMSAAGNYTSFVIGEMLLVYRNRKFYKGTWGYKVGQGKWTGQLRTPQDAANEMLRSIEMMMRLLVSKNMPWKDLLTKQSEWKGKGRR